MHQRVDCGYCTFSLVYSRNTAGGPSTADGPAEVMRVVREQIAAGADVVKVYRSSGSGQDIIF